ncbi:MAG: transglutaminase family protein [Proteobacteria bacterium]|nr:transglutaminase family protein [Pseudomonadota bacterium]
MTTVKENPMDYLQRLGQAGEGPHDIATAALMLAALDHSSRALEPYRAHLAEIADAARAEGRLTANVEDGARALAALLVGRYGYDGDRLAYEDPQNADFIAVMDRRRGLPVALGILYMHAARAAGYEACGLNTAGHFLLRMTVRGSEALIDPFNGGAAIDPEKLGAPPGRGSQAVEDIRLAEPVSDSDVLLRLENNLKMRAINTGERARALEIAHRMVLIAPRRGELWVDLAKINEAVGALGAAQKAYEACLALVKPGSALHNEAALAHHTLKRKLN